MIHWTNDRNNIGPMYCFGRFLCPYRLSRDALNYLINSWKFIFNMLCVCWHWKRTCWAQVERVPNGGDLNSSIHVVCLHRCKCTWSKWFARGWEPPNSYNIKIILIYFLLESVNGETDTVHWASRFHFFCKYIYTYRIDFGVTCIHFGSDLECVSISTRKETRQTVQVCACETKRIIFYYNNILNTKRNISYTWDMTIHCAGCGSPSCVIIYQIENSIQWQSNQSNIAKMP